MTAPVYTAEYGDDRAPAIVLLHGAGTNGWMWREQAASLATRFHVLVPDLPGHGQSAAVPWLSIDDTAQLVADLISSRTEHGVAHVTGLSLGGYVALTLASTQSDRIRSAIVSGVNVLPFAHPQLMRIIGRILEPLAHTDALIGANARSLRIPAESRSGYRTAARQVEPRTTRLVSDEAIGFRLPASARQSPVDLLAIAGEQEHDLVVRSLAVLASTFPQAVAALAPRGGHAWNADQGELFTSMIGNWVETRQVAPGLISI